jgi:hypothetical protein
MVLIPMEQVPEQSRRFVVEVVPRCDDRKAALRRDRLKKYRFTVPQTEHSSLCDRFAASGIGIPSARRSTMIGSFPRAPA